jgi:glutamate-1-semialdehyde aminotransferase
MLSNGVFFAPSAYEAGFISEAHTHKDFSEVYKLFTKFIKSIT